jgi:hypothetical protein
MASTFHYGTDKLTIGIVLAIASGKIKGILGDAAIKKIKRSMVSTLGSVFLPIHQSQKKTLPLYSIKSCKATALVWVILFGLKWPN